MVLPAPGETVDDLLPALTDGTWEGWMDELSVGELMVQMPKFELEWEQLLNDALKAMGMETAFDPFQADFSRMTPARRPYQRSPTEDLHAGRRRRDGGAAATSVTVGVTSAGPGITVDRPYVLAIRERLSGTILFLGAIRIRGSYRSLRRRTRPHRLIGGGADFMRPGRSSEAGVSGPLPHSPEARPVTPSSCPATRNTTRPDSSFRAQSEFTSSPCPVIGSEPSARTLHSPTNLVEGENLPSRSVTLPGNSAHKDLRLR